MRRKIIITDLTRFAKGNKNVCVAGIDPGAGECLRPMPYISMEICNGLGLVPGAVVVGDFTPVPNVTPPHTEDFFHRNLSVHGRCTDEEFRRILAESCFPGVELGFQVSLAAGERVIDSDYQGTRSIVTVRTQPTTVAIVEDRYKAGSLRLHFFDEKRRQHRFVPITDLGFYQYAEERRKRGELWALNSEIAAQGEVYLRIGLSRIHKSPGGKKGFWLQANGLYTFPKALRYTGMKTGTNPENA